MIISMLEQNDSNIIERFKSLREYAKKKNTTIKEVFPSWEQKEIENENVDTDLDDDSQVNKYERKLKITCKFCSKPNITSSNISFHYVSCLGIQTFNYFLNKENQGRSQCDICRKITLSKRQKHACNPQNKTRFKECEYCKFNFIDHKVCKVKDVVKRLDEVIKNEEKLNINQINEALHKQMKFVKGISQKKKYYFNDEQYFLDKGPELKSLNINKRIKKLRIQERIRFYKYKGFVGSSKFLKRNRDLIDLLFNFAAVEMQKQIYQEADEKWIFNEPKIFPVNNFKKNTYALHEGIKLKKKNNEIHKVIKPDLFDENDISRYEMALQKSRVGESDPLYIISYPCEKIDPEAYQKFLDFKNDKGDSFRNLNPPNLKKIDQSLTKLNRENKKDSNKISWKKCPNNLSKELYPSDEWIRTQVVDFKKRMIQKLQEKTKEKVNQVKSAFYDGKDECYNLYMGFKSFGLDVKGHYLKQKSSEDIKKIKEDTNQRIKKLKQLNKDLAQKLKNIKIEENLKKDEIERLTNDEIIHMFLGEYSKNYKIEKQKLQNINQAELLKQCSSIRSEINNTQTPFYLNSIRWEDKLGTNEGKGFRYFLGKKTLRNLVFCHGSNHIRNKIENMDIFKKSSPNNRSQESVLKEVK
jgi:hypothetical protein